MARKKTPAPAAVPPILGVVADVHGHNFSRHGGPMVDGLNRRGRESVATLRRAVEAAQAAGCRAFAIAGDLFHVRRPDPALIAAVQRALEVPDMAVIVVPGNHDCLDASAEGGNTACAPLINCTVVTRPTWFALAESSFDDKSVSDLAVLCVPFEGRVPMADHLEKVVAAMIKERPRARAFTLVTHVGVYAEADAAPWMVKAKDAMTAGRLLDLLGEAGFDSCFVGNYHDHGTWAAPGGRGGRERGVFQVGTLCPGSHTDGGLTDRGFLALTDGTGKGTRFEQIPGPRFLTTKDGVQDVRTAAEGFTYVLRQVGGKPPKKELIEAPNVLGYDYVAEEVQGAAGEAPAAGPRATPEEALRAAVAGLELDDEAVRVAVGDLVDRAWTEGA